MSELVDSLRGNLYYRAELSSGHPLHLDPELLAAEIAALDAAEEAISKLPGGSPATPKDERTIAEIVHDDMFGLPEYKPVDYAQAGITDSDQVQFGASLHLQPAVMAQLVRAVESGIEGNPTSIISQYTPDVDPTDRGDEARFLHQAAAARAAHVAEALKTLPNNGNPFVLKLAARLEHLPKAVLDMLLTTQRVQAEIKMATGRDTYRPQVSSRDEALAKREALKSDREWVTRYLNGDKSAQQQMFTLNQVIARG